MKRLSLLLAALLLSLGGCGKAGRRAPNAASPKPPAISVAVQEQTVTLLLGSYDWMEKLGGKEIGTAVDSLHPLQCQDLVPALTLSPEEVGSARLQCALPPTGYQVRRWSTVWWNDPEHAKSELVPVVTAPGDIDPEGELCFGVEPGYVYEVQALWEEPIGAGEGHGSAAYAFWVK